MPTTLTRHDQQVLADLAALAKRDAVTVVPPKPPTRCNTCQHFTPDPLNPPAGMGTCALDLGRWHAGAPHPCTSHQPL